MRELHSPRLVGSAEVLVDQRQTEVLDVDGTVDRLDGWHSARGSQDSNLEPPVLETGTLPLSYCPLAPILGSSPSSVLSACRSNASYQPRSSRSIHFARNGSLISANPPSRVISSSRSRA
jgi:hypothetical protein